MFSSDYEKQGQDISSSIDLDSDMFNPVYALRLQYRDPVLPSSVLLVKVLSESVVIPFSISIF